LRTKTLSVPETVLNNINVIHPEFTYGIAEVHDALQHSQFPICPTATQYMGTFSHGGAPQHGDESGVQERKDKTNPFGDDSTPPLPFTVWVDNQHTTDRNYL
jgi:hypothetical protein